MSRVYASVRIAVHYSGVKLYWFFCVIQAVKTNVLWDNKDYICIFS